jgi:hypothetical protein
MDPPVGHTLGCMWDTSAGECFGVGMPVNAEFSCSDWSSMWWIWGGALALVGFAIVAFRRWSISAHRGAGGSAAAATTGQYVGVPQADQDEWGWGEEEQGVEMHRPPQILRQSADEEEWEDTQAAIRASLAATSSSSSSTLGGVQRREAARPSRNLDSRAGHNASPPRPPAGDLFAELGIQARPTFSQAALAQTAQQHSRVSQVATAAGTDNETSGWDDLDDDLDLA